MLKVHCVEINYEKNIANRIFLTDLFLEIL